MISKDSMSEHDCCGYKKREERFLVARVDSIYWAVRPEIGQKILGTIEAEQERKDGGGCMLLCMVGMTGYLVIFSVSCDPIEFFFLFNWRSGRTRMLREPKGFFPAVPFKRTPQIQRR